MTSFMRVANQMSVGVKREFLSPSKVRLSLPWGFPYEAFGPSGTVKPWHVLNLVESGRSLSFNRLPNHAALAPFLSIEDLCVQHGLFQGSVRLTLTKELYDPTVPKTPLTLEKELVYVGRSSLNIHTEVLLPQQPDGSKSLPLATCEAQSVLVERKSRQPAPCPAWWRERYGAYSDPARQLVVQVQTQPRPRPKARFLVPAAAAGHPRSHEDLDGGTQASCPSRDLPIPDSPSSYSLRVCDSDSDAYGHANWSVYLKYCFDALMMGTPSQELGAVQLLKSRALKAADIAYVNEGSVGQDLRIRFWKDPVISGSVHFCIEDGISGNVISYAFLHFYALDDVTLPISSL